MIDLFRVTASSMIEFDRSATLVTFDAFVNHVGPVWTPFISLSGLTRDQQCGVLLDEQRYY